MTGARLLSVVVFACVGTACATLAGLDDSAPEVRSADGGPSTSSTSDGSTSSSGGSTSSGSTSSGSTSSGSTSSGGLEAGADTGTDSGPPPVCTGKLLDGASCTVGAQCCSDKCKRSAGSALSGACGNCRSDFSSCNSQDDCCVGSYCTSSVGVLGACARCKATGETADRDQLSGNPNPRSCCSGSQNNGMCQ